MIKIIPSKISGTLNAPPSKSQTLRALFFAFLAKGKSTIIDYLPSTDTFAMIEAIKNLGASVKIHKTYLTVKGTGGIISSKTPFIDAKNSGIILRFLSAAAALDKKAITITGDASIKNLRVISPLIKGLQSLGAKITSSKGRPPLTIQGPISNGKIYISGEDSQPISALLIISLFLKGPTELFIKNPKEKPWIDLTLSWLDFFHIPYICKNHTYYKIYGNTFLQNFEKKIESDFTSIYYPLTLALIKNTPLTIKGNFSEKFPDKKLLSILIHMGAHIEISKNTISIKKSSLQGRKIDMDDFIDTLPILCVLGCFIKGETILYNARIAKRKESNRIDAMFQELKKMGANIQKKSDGLIIKKSPLYGANLFSYKDHRIALSLTIAALLAKGESTLNNPFCTNKSYPSFFSDLKKLGANFL